MRPLGWLLTRVLRLILEWRRLWWLLRRVCLVGQIEQRANAHAPGLVALSPEPGPLLRNFALVAISPRVGHSPPVRSGENRVDAHQHMQPIIVADAPRV